MTYLSTLTWKLYYHKRDNVTTSELKQCLCIIFVYSHSFQYFWTIIYHNNHVFFFNLIAWNQFLFIRNNGFQLQIITICKLIAARFLIEASSYIKTSQTILHFQVDKYCHSLTIHKWFQKLLASIKCVWFWLEP